MVIDITRRIRPDMPVYPGNPGVVFEQAGKTSSALTRISLGSHTGTHIDAPSHIQKGAAGTDAYSLEQMIGEAEVVEINDQVPMTNDQSNPNVQHQNVVTVANLPMTSRDKVLIKTKNSSGDPNIFDPDFTALDESAAEELVRRGVRLVGIDGPSIKKKGVQDRVHAILLDAGVIVLEGLWLADVAAGSYELLCLPLALDLDGAPARVVLR